MKAIFYAPNCTTHFQISHLTTLRELHMTDIVLDINAALLEQLEEQRFAGLEVDVQLQNHRLTAALAGQRRSHELLVFQSFGVADGRRKACAHGPLSAELFDECLRHLQELVADIVGDTLEFPAK